MGQIADEVTLSTARDCCPLHCDIENEYSGVKERGECGFEREKGGTILQNERSEEGGELFDYMWRC